MIGIHILSKEIMTRTAIIGVLVLTALASIGIAQQKSEPVRVHARGSFTVDVSPLSPAPAQGLSRYSINKVIHGDLEATSKGEMFSGGDPQQGVAGYVAIEVVSGKLAGKPGSFALQHMATMDSNGSNMRVIVVPGSGTGDLKGISATFTILIKGEQHAYDLEYALPGTK